MKTNDIEYLRKIFVKRLTEDSETQNPNHEEFNHAVFNKNGWVRFGDIHVDMILHKFDTAVKALKRGKEEVKKYEKKR